MSDDTEEPFEKEEELSVRNNEQQRNEEQFTNLDNEEKDEEEVASSACCTVDVRTSELLTKDSEEYRQKTRRGVKSESDGDGRGEKGLLCGYMRVRSMDNKRNWRRIRNKKKISTKWYWVVYAENTCKLFYFRKNVDDKEATTTSEAPVGEMNIANATFLLKLDEDEDEEEMEIDNDENEGGRTRRSGPSGRSFVVSTPEEEYELEAVDRETALYWLQELQKRRRRFSRKKTAHIRRHGVHSSTSHLGKSSCGLLEERRSVESHDGNLDAIPPLVSPVVAPEGSVGQEAIRPRSKRDVSESSSATWFLSSFRSQIRSGIGRTKSSRSSDSSIADDSPTSPTSVEGTRVTLRNKAGKSFNLRKSFRNSLIMPFVQSPSSSEGCKKCEKLGLEMTYLEESYLDSSLELKTANEMISFLQKQLDLACRQKESVMKIHSNPNMECHMNLAIKKDVELAETMQKLDEVNRDLEDVQLEYMALRRELKDVTNYNKEMIQLKNQIINQLTEQLTNLEREEERRSAPIGQTVASSFTTTRTSVMSAADKTVISHSSSLIPYSEIDRLRDELQAYRLQNNFLNSEILQLNLLRNDGNEREEYIKMKCLDWEAKFYSIQSKYMVLLNECQSTKSDSRISSNQSASQLLNEAFRDSSSPDYLSLDKVLSSDTRYNIYGFSMSSSCQSYSLLKGAYLISQRSNEISGTLKEDRGMESWVAKWDRYIASLGKQTLQQSAVLKDLLRSGIPFFHRSRIWKGCVDLHIKHLRDSKPKNYYEEMLASARYGSVTDIASKQIELDLLRTLPHNKHFENAHSDGIPKLRRILLAYSQHNQGVGYCQGLNRLVAIALLFMNEEDAFWALVAIVEFLMAPDYYNRDLLGAQVDQLVLKELLFEKIPRLHTHFEDNKMDVSLFTFNWMLCVFVDCVPVETYLSIWDSFLYEGGKVLFRFALAILKMSEEECLKATDNLSASKILRSYSESLTDFRRLSQIAFNELNPFPRRAIANKRDQYTTVVKAEVDKMNERRATYRTLSRPVEGSFKYIPGARD